MALFRKMTIVILVVFQLLLVQCQRRPGPDCLTGNMTDVQTWVDRYGNLTPLVAPAEALDLSSSLNPIIILQTTLKSTDRHGRQLVKYLSLARCNLTRVPADLAGITDINGINIAATVEYLSLYGNNFVSVSTPGEQYDVILLADNATEVYNSRSMPSLDQSMWSNSFQVMEFVKLRELDLRACGIESLEANTFINLPNLEALYLGENMIASIRGFAFAGLKNLLHLDLSRNAARDSNGPTSMHIEHEEIFDDMPNLRSLDLSHTKMNQRNIAAFRNFGEKLERLSMCHIGSIKLGPGFFNSTALKYLDLSSLNDVLASRNVLSGLENTLEVLYANEVGLQNFDFFKNFRKLEILMLRKNDITTVKKSTADSLVNLQVLDLDRNRFESWLSPIFKDMPSLKVLHLRNNNLNLLTEEMILDFVNIWYLGLSSNSLVCNCHSKELVDTAATNEFKNTNAKIKAINPKYKNFSFYYHNAFKNYNKMINTRLNISFVCDEHSCSSDDWRPAGKYLLLDYNMQYRCLLTPKNNPVPFVTLKTCYEENKRDIHSQLEKGWKRLLMLLLIPGILLPGLLVIFMFRRNIRYFYIMIRNTAMLSMVNKNKIIDDDTVFNYDVFVSYCNGDRPWVLDQLLSHLETDCSVSLCLHERDFQIGLSILENIVSCMDRSKAIMLVISKEFLASQWCQFEMHLAQHRLLETRREDLILILLEDIPRRLRPNTLHYLMLTKTYIVWPKNKSEEQYFWKRLKKCIVTQKLKHRDQISFSRDV